MKIQQKKEEWMKTIMHFEAEVEMCWANYMTFTNNYVKADCVDCTLPLLEIISEVEVCIASNMVHGTHVLDPYELVSKW